MECRKNASTALVIILYELKAVKWATADSSGQAV